MNKSSGLTVVLTLAMLTPLSSFAANEDLFGNRPPPYDPLDEFEVSAQMNRTTGDSDALINLCLKILTEQATRDLAVVRLMNELANEVLAIGYILGAEQPLDSVYTSAAHFYRDSLGDMRAIDKVRLFKVQSIMQGNTGSPLSIREFAAIALALYPHREFVDHSAAISAGKTASPKLFVAIEDYLISKN